MKETIKVFDLKTACFREMKNTANNCEGGIGLVFFTRRAIDVIKHHYRICGYIVLGESGEYYPVDIQKDTITFFEENYLQLDNRVQRELLEFNVEEKPKYYMTRFFWDWQFEGKKDVFDTYEPLYKLCSLILGNPEIIGRLSAMRLDIVQPTVYGELCQFVQAVGRLFNTDFYDKTFTEEVNYVIDSLLNGYRIEMSTSDIERYCHLISKIICDAEEPSHE